MIRRDGEKKLIVESAPALWLRQFLIVFARERGAKLMTGLLLYGRAAGLSALALFS
jgi:hypothetical protein